MKDKIIYWLTRRLPKKLVYWCGIRLWANATQGKWAHYEAPAVTMDEALKRFSDD